jgi:hypothetical protein
VIGNAQKLATFLQCLSDLMEQHLNQCMTQARMLDDKGDEALGQQIVAALLTLEKLPFFNACTQVNNFK